MQNWRSILDIIFPKTCLVCGCRGDYVCRECALKLRRVGEHHCSVCGIPFVGMTGCHPCSSCIETPPHYAKHRAVFVFNDDVKKIVHGLKYHAQFWTREIFKSKLENLLDEFPHVDIIVPVPLHSQRLKQRGYNQSVLLAKTIGQLIQNPVDVEALARVVDTPSQTGLNKAARIKNLKTAFQVTTPHSILNKKILLVDDVHTTGTTLSLAARALKRAGAERVDAFTMAIVP